MFHRDLGMLGATFFGPLFGCGGRSRSSVGCSCRCVSAQTNRWRGCRNGRRMGSGNHCRADWRGRLRRLRLRCCDRWAWYRDCRGWRWRRYGRRAHARIILANHFIYRS